jgi:hypothetical protein
VLTAEDYEKVTRLKQELLAARESIRVYWPWFDERADLIARINEQQIFAVRPLSSEVSGIPRAF